MRESPQGLSFLVLSSFVCVIRRGWPVAAKLPFLKLPLLKLLLLLPVLGSAAAPADPVHGDHTGHPAHRTFDDPEAYARTWENPERDAWQRPAELVQALAIEPGMQVADIGSGTGYLLPWLSRAAGSDGKVHAVDISREMLDWIGKRTARDGLTNVATVLATEAATGLPAEALDRAIMINVWHHVGDPTAYAADLFRVMKSSGVLFIVETKPDATQAGGPPPHFRLDPARVIASLRAAGFRAQLDPFEIDRQYVVRAQK